MSRVTIFEGLGELPFYNEEIDPAVGAEGEEPARVAALRAAAAEADAALVVTPEYNGSIPAVVKNAIDWLSRPFGNGALKGKPLAVIGGAFGQYGGVWAHDETRKSFGIAGARVVESIKLSVAFQRLGTARLPWSMPNWSPAVRDSARQARRRGELTRWLVGGIVSDE